MLRIILPGIPPSNNKYMGKTQNHGVYQADKQYWQDMVGWSVKATGWRGEPLKKAKVELIYHFANSTRRDPDNYSGKFILDGLKKFGVIVDDSFNNIQLLLSMGKNDKGNPHVEIFVTALE